MKKIINAHDAKLVSENASVELEKAIHADGGEIDRALLAITAAAAKGERGVVLYYDTRPKAKAMADALEARYFTVVDVATPYMSPSPAVAFNGKGGPVLGASQFAIGVTW
jgi:hypothetical protein